MGTTLGTWTSPSLDLVRKTQPSKRRLEIALAKLKVLETPNLKLEQYPVSPETAAELLFMAGFEHDDLDGHVIDLGTGTGRLAIGAALMGCGHVTGVDIDAAAIELAKENAQIAGIEAEWVNEPIDKVRGKYDTVIMNPPYGTRTIHADMRFLVKAFELAPIIYSIHKSSTRRFLVEYFTKFGHRLNESRSMRMKIPHLFKFHSRRWTNVEVDLYRILS